MYYFPKKKNRYLYRLSLSLYSISSLLLTFTADAIFCKISLLLIFCKSDNLPKLISRILWNTVPRHTQSLKEPKKKTNPNNTTVRMKYGKTKQKNWNNNCWTEKKEKKLQKKPHITTHEHTYTPMSIRRKQKTQKNCWNKKSLCWWDVGKNIK